MTVLVTGGAGYIGSVTVEALRSLGESVVVLDDLSCGHARTIARDVPLYIGDAGDHALVRRILGEHDVAACIHLGAVGIDGRTIHHPARYPKNKVIQGIGLMAALVEGGVSTVVFSSAAAVYGSPGSVPIPESTPLQPLNPHGASKVMLEDTMKMLEQAYGIRSVALRQFNVAGAVGPLSEAHRPETHLIPQILASAAGDGPPLTVFGADYPTRDGSAVRDYVHVADVAAAHVAALRYLRDGGASRPVNIGRGIGHSVFEVIEVVAGLVGPVAWDVGARRPGDPPEIVAQITRAESVLGWEPQWDLPAMIESAWRARPHGRRPLGPARSHMKVNA